jgi:hypothetical protein
LVVSFFKPKFVLLALVTALLPAVWTSGCSGTAFSSADNTTAGNSGASSGGSSNAGGLGTGAGTGVKCAGPEDCDDKDACTSDLCNADGTCDASPKCSGTEKCCDGGDCAECCTDADCDDGISCTMNSCFSGQCRYVPDDTQCLKTQYCSAKDGCRARQACGILPNEPADTCSDDNACTVDSCESNLCQHDFCPDANATLCCEGVGCAACCNDSQCNTGSNPCMVGSCAAGKCTTVPLCGHGDECCPSADGKTATCGKCCSAVECDDKVGCTEDKCGGGQCSHSPTASCGAGQICDLKNGCQKAPDCTTANDCKPQAGSCQTNPKCDAGSCHFDTCTPPAKCCGAVAGGTAGCAMCCSNAECTDNIECTVDTCTANGCTHTPDKTKCATGQQCDPQVGCVGCLKPSDCDDGKSCTTDACNQGTCSNLSTCGKLSYCTANGCSQCVSDSDCQGGVIAKIATPPIGTSCSVSKCVQGQCQTQLQSCGDLQVCCAPYGCQTRCLQTQ